MKTWIAISISATMLPDADGFDQNATIEYRQQGTCGDVAGLPIRRNDWWETYIHKPALWSGAISAGMPYMKRKRQENK